MTLGENEGCFGQEKRKREGKEKREEKDEKKMCAECE